MSSDEIKARDPDITVGYDDMDGDQATTRIGWSAVCWLKQIAYQLAVMNEQRNDEWRWEQERYWDEQERLNAKSSGSKVGAGSETEVRGRSELYCGHYWVWYESEWRLAKWDGEDWDVLGWGATVPMRHVIIGKRVAEAPQRPPSTADERTTPPNPQTSSIQP
jgi:hypothetical protein